MPRVRTFVYYKIIYCLTPDPTNPTWAQEGIIPRQARQALFWNLLVQPKHNFPLPQLRRNGPMALPRWRGSLDCASLNKRESFHDPENSVHT